MRMHGRSWCAPQCFALSASPDGIVIVAIVAIAATTAGVDRNRASAIGMAASIAATNTLPVVTILAADE